MKKLLITLLSMLLVIGLFGCSKKEEAVNTETTDTQETVVDLSSFKVVTPTGAPAIAFYNWADNANFETNAAPKNIVAMMADGNGPDAVVIDTTSGIAAIGNGANYKLAATLTFGNFFIASTGNDDDSTMDGDDKIVLFGEGQIADYVFHYVYGDEFNEAITYVPAVTDAAAILQNKEGKDVEGNAYDYVFVAQPVLFASLKQNENASVYADIQKLYTEKSNTSMIQASLFINNNVDDATAEAFLASLEADVNAAIENADLVAEGLAKISEEEAKAKYGVATAPIVAVIKQGNGIGLGFKRAKDIKSDIDAFMNVMGKNETSEEIYR